MKRSIRSRHKPAFLALWLPIALCCASGSRVHGQDERPALHKRTKLFSGIISSSELETPLRSMAYVRFSPDERYILIQDPVGVFVFSTDPLEPRLFVQANFDYPARFSADSNSLVLLSRSLLYGRWALPNGKKVEEEQLNVGEGCLRAALSLDGSLLGCYRTDLSLGIYRAATGEQLALFRLHEARSLPQRTMMSLDTESASGGAFGFIMIDGFGALAGRDRFASSVFFSPDGKSLVAGDMQASIGIDIASLSKRKLHGAVEKRILDVAGLPDDDRALLLGASATDPAAIVSLSSGATLSRVSLENLSASQVSLASDPRFALVRDPESNTISVHDLQDNRTIEIPEGIGADISKNMLALYTEEGELGLYHLGETVPQRKSVYPRRDLALLHSAAVSPTLDKIALAVDGEAAIFDVASGKRVTSLTRFQTASLNDVASAYVTAIAGKSVFATKRFTYSTAELTAAWTIEQFDQPYPSSHVILNYVPYSPWGKGFAVNLSNMFEYELRGLDPATGKQLWHRAFSMITPIPFSYPQGDSFVLGWKANTNPARDIAGKYASAKAAYKKAKIQDQDSFFEVCDAQTGKTTGAFLAQFGGGPHTFDQAFAVGDALFLVKDQTRVTIVSVARGEIIARLSGALLTASAKANLFLTEEAPGIINVYDLATYRKLTALRFKQQIVYARFSDAGDRLLLLTEQQEAYVLDVKAVKEAGSGAAD